MKYQNYDLHMHSTASDGTLSPQMLLTRVEEAGLETIALTDHDTVAGVAELIAVETPVHVIPGAEFTSMWNSRVVHIIGLGLQLESQKLSSYLHLLDQLRDERAEKIALKLQKRALPDLLPLVKEQAKGSVLGRPHFAKAMVELGLVQDEQQAFNNYLGSGKPGDVKVAWPSLAETVDLITSVGGVAVLAHPTKYKFTFTKLREFLADFVPLGGRGIEVSYSGLTPSHHHELIRLAGNHDMLVSAGSDFHSPAHHWAGLGKFMPIKKEIPHVLDVLL